MPDIITINDKVQAALEKLFQQHRLVFWYDDHAEMTDLFESIQLPEVEKVIIANNELSAIGGVITANKFVGIKHLKRQKKVVLYEVT